MNLLEAIGRTPLVELMHVGARPGVRILCKLEGCNPGGSVKDRPALSMIAGAEERGDLTSGKAILEPTSGNTGIAIAMIGAAKGYRVHLCMPECVSAERSMILQGLGAEVSLTPAKEGIDGAIWEARSLLEREPDTYYMPNQYENPDNIRAHVETTGPEIYEQTSGEVDYFVAGMGTTGTLMGTGRYLRSKKPGVRIVGVRTGDGPRHPGAQEHDRVDGARHLRRGRPRRQTHGLGRGGLRHDEAPRSQRGALRGVIERRRSRGRDADRRRDR